MKKKKVYILYDGRANFTDTEFCSIASTANSIKEVKRDSKMFPDDYVWFEYEVNEKMELINEKRLVL